VLLGTGAALVCLVGYLLVAHHRAGVRLREHVLGHRAQHVQLQAAALGHLAASAAQDLRYLAESREVAAFFESRDLGMSMQYGLALSLVPIRARLRALVEGTDETPARFLRVLMLDPDGDVLADSGGPPLDVEPTVLHSGSSGAFLTRDLRQIALRRRLDFKGRPVATFVASLRPDRLHDVLAPAAGETWFVLDPEGRVHQPADAAAEAPRGLERLPADGRVAELPATGEAGGSGGLAARSIVPGQALTLVHVDSHALLGEFSPLASVVQLGIASIALFLVLGLAILLNTRSLVLEARLEESLVREREVGARNSALAEALARAEESSRLKGEFVANVSHELRTPLNAIINVPEGLLELVARCRRARCGACRTELGLEPGEQVTEASACPSCGAAGALREYHALEGAVGEIARNLALVVGSARHLLGVVNDILDFSKLNAGRAQLAPREVKVSRLVDEALAMLAPVAKGRGVRLARPSPVGEDLTVEADPVKCSQVLVNLVGNAIKFSEAGQQVDVWVTDEGGSVRLSVEDEGVGIAPEHQRVIFEPFRQVDGSHTRRHRGTGLGLAITRELVEAHGGEVWVESVLGAGSTFHVRLPKRWRRGLAAAPSAPPPVLAAPTASVPQRAEVAR
jgi:signal transduction histidine kinase